jgi:transcriptional regulator with XRE-family HTH domain
VRIDRPTSRASAPLGSNQQGGPTVLRIVLGTQLRRWREAAGISREAAGDAIRGSHAKISRIELGRVGFKERDLVDLLALYGITDEEAREEFLDLARRANQRGWWQQHGHILPAWFEMYLGLEQAAIDEAALSRPFGAPHVMRAQLEHLLEMADLPNVSVQVLPFRLGSHAAAGGAFTILRFAEPDLPDVVYLEHLNSAVYLDKRSEVEDYLAAMERVSVQAETPVRSKDTLRRLRAEI